MRATVVDMTGLDGCGRLLILEDGRKLLPTNLHATLAEMTTDQQVSISFKIVEDMASICMAEDHMVELTCLVTVAAEGPCPEMVDPYRPSWSLTVMKALDPERVERLTTDNVDLYHYVGKRESRIYDCYGNLRCRYATGARADCDEVFSTATSTTIIYVLDQTP